LKSPSDDNNVQTTVHITSDQCDFFFFCSNAAEITVDEKTLLKINHHINKFQLTNDSATV